MWGKGEEQQESTTHNTRMRILIVLHTHHTFDYDLQLYRRQQTSLDDGTHKQILQDLLSDQRFKDLADSLGALLGVAFLPAFVVHEGHAKARLVAFCPFEVAATERVSD